MRINPTKTAFFFILVMSTAFSACQHGAATSASRDVQVDQALSQKKMTPNPAKISQSLEEPQTGFPQEPAVPSGESSK